MKINKFNRHDSDDYRPTTIKDTTQWFPFTTIMEHTANITETKNGLILSLLKIIAMFELRLLSGKEILDVVPIRRINFKI